MSLTLSEPGGPSVSNQLPMFKSIRSQPITRAVRRKIATAKLEAAKVTIVAVAKPDPWYETRTPFETFLDVFWSRRTIVGESRSRGSYYRSLKWQAVASVPLFPPLGLLIVLLNMCFGLQPKPTRIGFIASCALGILFALNIMFASDPTTLAALK